MGPTLAPIRAAFRPLRFSLPRVRFSWLRSQIRLPSINFPLPPIRLTRSLVRVPELRGRRDAAFRPLRLALRPIRFEPRVPRWADLGADRRLAPALVLLLVLVALVGAALPTAAPAIGSTSISTGPAAPAIAGLRGAGAPLTVGAGPASRPDGARLTSEAQPPAVAGGDYTFDGTLEKPLGADPLAGGVSLGVYVVQSGDTLTGIAAKLGLSMMTLWWANQLSAKDELHIGQRLLVPPVNGVVYSVREGDSLASIAAAFSADPATIMSYNGLSGDEVTLGQRLMIPDGVGASIASAPSKPSAPRPVARSSGVSSASGPSGCLSCPFVPLAWPVPGGYISQYFHYGHEAIDIAADYGSRIVAAAAGTVIFAGWKNNGGGWQVWISHGHNFYTAYYHMSSLGSYAGESVGRGQFIGRIGMTGSATGPHCHFEVWIGMLWVGYRVNPLRYF